MTETQATSGPAEADTSPAGGNDSSAPGTEAGDAGAGATGTAARAAVGRAAVPGEKSAGGEPAAAPPSAPKYTRAPGMPPPPDVLLPPKTPVDGATVAGAPMSAPPAPTWHGPPVVPVGAIARASVRGPGSAGLRAGTGTVPVVTPGPATGTARVSEAVRTARATVSSAASRGPRRARLHLKRIDPWSVMKFSFAVSLVLFVVAIIATAVLYVALDAMGVFTSVNKALADMVGATGGQASGGFKITARNVIGGAALLGLVNVVLFTALATLGAFIYNVCADLVGGIELTLAEKD
jgi:hypothetical protein